VHLHTDDATAQRLEGQRNGTTEAWHILDAAPGATALCGVRPGVDADTLRKALVAQDFDAVLRRLPVRAGETIYVPAGTLHSFGPDTLVYEIEQASDIQQHAVHWQMEDGSEVPEQEWHTNPDTLTQEVKLEPRRWARWRSTGRRTCCWATCPTSPRTCCGSYGGPATATRPSPPWAACRRDGAHRRRRGTTRRRRIR
jgi:hypothetical protein